jgi:hypothetical protein
MPCVEDGRPGPANGMGHNVRYVKVNLEIKYLSKVYDIIHQEPATKIKHTNKQIRGRRKLTKAKDI